MVEKRLAFANPDGLTLQGILHVPDRSRDPGVVIAHGFTGSKDTNFFPDLARCLVVRGYPTLRFDFSGNGENEGLFESRTYTLYAADLEAAVHVLRPRVTQVVVIGFSMGGAVAVIHAATRRTVDGLVLLAPAFRLVGERWDRRQLEQEGEVRFVDSHGRPRRLLRAYFEDRDRHDYLAYARRIEIPVLVMVGTEEDTVDPGFCRTFVDTLPHDRKHFVSLPGENHVFHNRIDALCSPLFAFLDTFFGTAR
ncbi:MAG: lysophospholipase [Candidatus Hydrothermae bacterium]|nr:lysophospholipase [Candidatus Hydrothermae bacterium]